MPGMSKVMKTCHNCGSNYLVQNHHSHHGIANRKICDRYLKMQFNLCWWCHHSNYGIHGKFGDELNKKYQKIGQEIFEKKYGTREEFRKLFGKNYL